MVHSNIKRISGPEFIVNTKIDLKKLFPNEK